MGKTEGEGIWEGEGHGKQGEMGRGERIERSGEEG